MPLFVQNQEHNFCYHLYYRCDILSQLTQTEFFFFPIQAKEAESQTKAMYQEAISKEALLASEQPKLCTWNLHQDMKQ